MDRSRKLRLSSTDRLSQLPEEILCHILSLLPTKTSIATSVLSKRWHNLWTLVPVLDFDMSRDVPHMDIHNFTQKLHFSNFVNNALLLHRHHPINIFRLTFPIGELANYDDPIKRWFLAVSRRLQELELQVTGISFTFPRDICFSNLLVLKLRDSFLGSVESGLFPKLKVLHLTNITFVDMMGGSLRNFLHACPVLEELRTHGWQGQGHGLRRVIVAPTLTSLDVGFFPNSMELVLDTPALEYLSLDHACCADTLLASSLHNLRRADINCFVDEEEVMHRSCGSRVMRLLSQLSSIEFLKLSYDKMSAYEDPMREQHLLHARGTARALDDYSCVEQLPVFHNLVRLELCIPTCNYVLLPQLLLKLHSLQHIVINKNLSIDVAEVRWKEPLEVPICLSSTLLSFRIEDFEGLEAEVELVKYVMKHAMVLKDVTLNTSRCLKLFKERFNAMHELVTIRRGSEACKLHLNFNLGGPISLK